MPATAVLKPGLWKADTRVSPLPVRIELSRQISLLVRRNAIWTPLINAFRAVLAYAMHLERKSK